MRLVMPAFMRHDPDQNHHVLTMPGIPQPHGENPSKTHHFQETVLDSLLSMANPPGPLARLTRLAGPARPEEGTAWTTNSPQPDPLDC